MTAGYLVAASGAVAVVVAALSFAGYRNSGFDDEVRREMLDVLVVVLPIACLSWGLAELGTLPYWADVACGSAGGYAISVWIRGELL